MSASRARALSYRAIGEAASACIACGPCEVGCSLAAAVPVIPTGVPISRIVQHLLVRASAPAAPGPLGGA